MSITSRIQKSVTLGGEPFNQSVSPTGDGVIVQSVTLPAALSGILTERISDNSGIVSINGGIHSFVETNRIDVWWPPVFNQDDEKYDQNHKNMELSLDSNNDLELTGGFGDKLPNVGSTVFVRATYAIPLSVNTNQLLALILHTAGNGEFHFTQTNEVPLFSVAINKGFVFDWQNGSGAPAPFSANQAIGKIFISHTETTSSADMKIGMLLTNAV